MKLLFAETFRLGDCLYTAAVIDALQKNLEADMHVIVSGLSAGFDWVWKRMGVEIHRFSFPWERSGWQYHPLRIGSSLRAVRASLRPAMYGAIGLNPRGSFLQQQVLRAAGAEAPLSLEYAAGTSMKERFLGRDRRCIFDSRQHFLSQAAVALDQMPLQLDPGFLSRFVTAAEPHQSVVLSPGASNAVKHWPASFWLRLAGELQADGTPVAVLEHSSSNVPRTLWPEGVRFVQGSLEQTLNELAGAKAVVSTDSFVAHASAFLGLRTVVLFGAQKPELWCPPGAKAVYADPFACRPCSQKLDRCRFGHRCMQMLEPDAVKEAVLREKQ